MGLAAFVQAVLAALGLVSASPAPPGQTPALTAREKAALVVVSGLPAPPGVAGVIVRRWNRDAPRPPRALVFADQEGAAARAFPELPPAGSASSYATAADARRAGRATGRALRRAGVHVDLAPVLDLAGGPLGSRHFGDPPLGVAFARGLIAGGVAACPKHFPGLGSAPFSTDEGRAHARVRAPELAAFRAAVAAGADCVMTSNAVYARFGPRRAALEPAAYALLRRSGFRGVTITDSLSVLGRRLGPVWARLAVKAGADLVLFTSGEDAAHAIKALVPLAREGLLDEHVARVLRLRRSFGLGRP